MGRRDHRPKNEKEEERTKGEQRTETAIMRRCVPKQSVGSRFLVVTLATEGPHREYERTESLLMTCNDDRGRVVLFIEGDNTWHGFGSVKKTSKHTMLQDIFNVETKVMSIERDSGQREPFLQAWKEKLCYFLELSNKPEEEEEDEEEEKEEEKEEEEEEMKRGEKGGPRETALIPESLAAGQCCEATDVERLIIQDSGLCSSALCQERNPVVAIEGLYRSLPIP
ncbi:hypothetical protein V1478_003879 [Vespula squamosa]|uniref:Uncharacterized protein n=1 Tax=Vespula squamosa TaxID=30214 RepID=A0ABD2BN46_VESSQ